MTGERFEWHLLDLRVHISQRSPWGGHGIHAGHADGVEPHGCCTCPHPLHVSAVGECQRCYRLVRPGSTARLVEFGRAEMLS